MKEMASRYGKELHSQAANKGAFFQLEG